MRRLAEIRARCAKSELVALRLIAKREGRKPTDVLRDLVVREARTYGIWPVPQDVVDAEDICEYDIERTDQ